MQLRRADPLDEAFNLFALRDYQNVDTNDHADIQLGLSAGHQDTQCTVLCGSSSGDEEW